MSYLIDQEAWLAFYAERLQVSPENLGERDIRLALALYHGIYLPTAATIELRSNELDLRQRFAEFGFEPDVASFATAKVRVTVPAAPAGGSYSLAAPFIVVQGDLRFIATEALVIPVGQTVGEAEIKAEMQGRDGTPDEAAASITASAGWLRGATVVIADVSPGRDGSEIAEIRTLFRAYAFNPQALVRDVDHADYVGLNFPDIGRAFASARTEVLYTPPSTYTKTAPKAGHLTLALVDQAGGAATDAQTTAVKDALLHVTVPYGASALHVIPAQPVPISGTIGAVIEPGADEDDIKTNMLEAIQRHLDWRTWPHERPVFAGQLWGAIASVPNVRYIVDITLNGRLLDATPDALVYELEPWEYPTPSIAAGDITLTEAQ